MPGWCWPRWRSTSPAPRGASHRPSTPEPPQRPASPPHQRPRPASPLRPQARPAPTQALAPAAGLGTTLGRHHGPATSALNCLTNPAHQPQPGTRSGTAGQAGRYPVSKTTSKINKPSGQSRHHETVDPGSARVGVPADTAVADNPHHREHGGITQSGNKNRPNSSVGLNRRSVPFISIGFCSATMRDATRSCVRGSLVLRVRLPADLMTAGEAIASGPTDCPSKEGVRWVRGFQLLALPGTCRSAVQFGWGK